jgi:hypothetical protein
MKAFGRLLLATALIVPAGLMTAQSAGATPKDTATCTGNTGTLHLSPGVRSTDKAAQVIRNFTAGNINNPTNPGRVEGCDGIGIGDPTGGTFAFKLEGGGNVSCSSIRHRTYTGRGVIDWDEDGSNAHIVTQLRVQLTIDTYKHVTFSGVVDSNYLKGTHLEGEASIPDTLKPDGVGGGACQNKKRVKNLDYTNIGDTKL